MPFDFEDYDVKCAAMDKDALQREWEHYTRLISGAATSTAISGAAVPFTFGVSAIGVGASGSAIFNAHKKREIIEKHFRRLGATQNTRKRDVLTPIAISGTVSIFTLGLCSAGTDAIVNKAAEHSIVYIAENEIAVKVGTHLALESVAVTAEKAHATHKKEKEERIACMTLAQAGNVPALPPGTGFVGVPSSLSQGYGAVKVDLGDTMYSLDPNATSSSPPRYPGSSSSATEFYFPPPPGSGQLTPSNLAGSFTPTYMPTSKSPLAYANPDHSDHSPFGPNSVVPPPPTASMCRDGMPQRLYGNGNTGSYLAALTPDPAVDIRYQYPESTANITTEGCSPSLLVSNGWQYIGTCDVEPVLTAFSAMQVRGEDPPTQENQFTANKYTRPSLSGVNQPVQQPASPAVSTASSVHPCTTSIYFPPPPFSSSLQGRATGPTVLSLSSTHTFSSRALQPIQQQQHLDYSSSASSINQPDCQCEQFQQVYQPCPPRPATSNLSSTMSSAFDFPASASTHYAESNPSTYNPATYDPSAYNAPTSSAAPYNPATYAPSSFHR